MSRETSKPTAAPTTGWLRRCYDEHPKTARAAQFGLVIAATLFVSWLMWGGGDSSVPGDVAIATAAVQLDGSTMWN